MYTAEQIARAIPGSRIHGDVSASVRTVAPIDAAGPGSLSWLRSGRQIPREWAGSALLVGPGTVGRVAPKQAVIHCPNPRLALGYALRQFFSARIVEPVITIDPTAWIDPTAVIDRDGQAYEWDGERWFAIPHVAGAVIGADVVIGPMTTVMRGLLQDTVVGPGCRIGAHCNVGHGATLGPHCVLGPYAAVGGSCRIGPRVTIWSKAVIRNGVTVGAGAILGQAANVLTDVPEGETWYGNPAKRA